MMNRGQARRRLGAACASLLLAAGTAIHAEDPKDTPPAPPATPPAAAPAEQEAPKIPADELDSLVAPIALYPAPLLAQTLVASTYPLEIVQLPQWLAKPPGLHDKAPLGGGRQHLLEFGLRLVEVPEFRQGSAKGDTG